MRDSRKTAEQYRGDSWIKQKQDFMNEEKKQTSVTGQDLRQKDLNIKKFDNKEYVHV